jgi:membrane associated rhomboid family serine protease
MFLHEGWMHIGGNMLFLWAFGPEIEDVMGSGRYLLFYLLGGVAATFAQVLADPHSTIPSLGASGAIAAVMGAFLITYPRDQIRTVVLFGWFVRLTLMPAIVLVGIWFLTQVFSEVGSVATMDTGGVAYMAHIGGFIFGALFNRLFETGKRRMEEGLD